MKILLIGDSIRMGYDKYVAEKLKGKAEVVWIPENSQFTEYTLRHLKDWKKSLNLDTVDAVHWNVGLWDSLRLYGDFETLTRPDIYAENIRRIQKMLYFHFPTAKMIFATSTPVVEERFDPLSAVRYNRDIEHFNQLAVDVLADYPVEINDLWSLVWGKPESLWSDMTHLYTEEGTRLLGDAVCRAICRALDIEEA